MIVTAILLIRRVRRVAIDFKTRDRGDGNGDVNAGVGVINLSKSSARSSDSRCGDDELQGCSGRVERSGIDWSQTVEEMTGFSDG